MYCNSDKEALELYFKWMRWKAYYNRKRNKTCRECCKYRR